MSQRRPSAVKRIYLDVCALCRPFDDQQQVRIRLETSAVELILAHIRQGDLALVASPAHEVEIGAINDTEEQQHLLLLVAELRTSWAFDLPAVRQRAEQLAAQGLGVADAAHLAFAEAAQAEFVSVDDRLLRQCRRIKSQVWCGSPMAFCEKESLR
jgi:predicted nucleic acid-binding protein